MRNLILQRFPGTEVIGSNFPPSAFAVGHGGGRGRSEPSSRWAAGKQGTRRMKKRGVRSRTRRDETRRLKRTGEGEKDRDDDGTGRKAARRRGAARGAGTFRHDGAVRSCETGQISSPQKAYFAAFPHLEMWSTLEPVRSSGPPRGREHNDRRGAAVSAYRHGGRARAGRTRCTSSSPSGDFSPPRSFPASPERATDA